MLDGSAGSTPASPGAVVGVDVPRLKLEQAPKNSDKAATTDRFRTVRAYPKLIMAFPRTGSWSHPTPTNPKSAVGATTTPRFPGLISLNNMLNRSQEGLNLALLDRIGARPYFGHTI